ncbi:MAG: chromate resistance protein [Thermoanaerobaculia bacterium]|nr:MAG: chromate resistance protein [Thermoanaerobaculia bacterium]
MPATAATSAPDRLLLLHELPPGKSTGRVTVWRRLRRIGAESVGAAWALPLDEENREAFEWLRGEIVALGGRCAIFEAREVSGAGGPDETAEVARLERSGYRRRVWVTRPRPGIDRMASAWLIRRFVDPEARFEFSEKAPGGRSRRIAFDMFGAAFGHRGRRCSFEVLAASFGLKESRIRELGGLVRAVDLHEEAADPAAARMIERLVAGLRASHADDFGLLEAGMALFEALYSSPPPGAGTGQRAGARPAPRDGKERRQRR